ncbi:MAG: hypothetical protein COY39_03045 [Alphaproteobacteria bacterium CG_4_10_14_0_8_um_filter_37_21]|nr:MAG: hypothetical protein COY39_03045 [Alphaproteobacteria bacterium CG_4_10_14_0_8_um_filter_37_21]
MHLLQDYLKSTNKKLIFKKNIMKFFIKSEFSRYVICILLESKMDIYSLSIIKINKMWNSWKIYF